MNIEFNKITPAWRALEQATHLGPIRDEAHYDEMVALAHALVDEVGGNHEAHPLNGLLYLVGELIRDYDEKHYPVPTASGVDALKFLMETHGLNQADFPEIGTQGVMSEILSGERALNVRQITLLAQRFGVSADVFLDIE